MKRQEHTTIYIALFISLILCSKALFAESFSVNDIKPIKTAKSNSYVSNQDGVLSPETCKLLNQKLTALEKQTTAQVAVVVLKSSEGMSARDLSMELFDKWKVGNKNSNNGLIVMLLIEERDVFIRTGYGLEGAITDAKATDIVNDIMAPYFKEGNWDQGILAGVDQITQLVTKEYATEGFQTPEKEQEKLNTLLYMYIAISFILLVFAIILIHSATSKFNISHKEEKINAFKKRMKPWLFLGILFPLLLVVIAVWYWCFFKPIVRYHHNKCPNCGKRMHLLGEKEEDSFLSKKQQMEEAVKSKDYDVWLCPNCSTSSIYCYDNSLTRYSICPECKAKTMRLVSDVVITEATQFANGVGRKTYECRNCGKQTIHTYPIEHLAVPVIIGGGGHGGGGGFSGGSFGGGMSGGGGGGGHF